MFSYSDVVVSVKDIVVPLVVVVQKVNKNYLLLLTLLMI